MMNWMNDASCREIDGDLWFAEGTYFVATKLAKKVCNSCPVRDECLEYALADRIEFGVWGGLTASERKSLLRKVKVPRRK